MAPPAPAPGPVCGRAEAACSRQLVVVLLLVCCLAAVTAESALSEVTVVAGRWARLPCPQLSQQQQSSVSLVIWYKDGEPNPIYSYDIRKGRSAHHWADPLLLGHSRASYRPAEGHLVLKEVRQTDQGRYRCRVDFRLVPTVTGDVLLNVIVPPEAPVVRNETGDLIANNSQLAVIEGERLKLTCEVKKGHPPPRVTWLMQNASASVPVKVVDLAYGTRVTSELVLPKLRRTDLHTNVSCQAENNNVTGPVTTTVTLDIFLRPLRVQQQGEEGPLSVGEQYEYVCRSSGSRPPATLTWFLAGNALLNARQHTSADGGTSVSTLQLRPALGDQGKKLVCRAQNTRIPGKNYIEDDRHLDIRYPPVATLRLNPMISADNVREGMGVFFDCEVSANPPPNLVIWLHKGSEVVMDRKAGVLVSTKSLVLQNVSRHAAGPYQCHAVNSEGESTSNTATLRVMYAPVCAEQQRRVYGVSRGEQAAVLCRVDADPPPVEFSWQLNSSDQLRPLTAGVTHWPAGPRTSSAVVAPQHDRDYGTLLCSSRNRVGHQAQPCAFSIVPAGPPEPVGGCSVSNQTDVSFVVRCSPGFDGGLQQLFSLELYGRERRLKLNTSREQPLFSVAGLEPGVQYTAMVYAVNQKGASRRVHIAVATQMAAEQRTGKSTQGSMAERRPAVDWTPLVGVIAGASLAVLACVLAVIMMVRRRAGQPSKSPAKSAAGLSDGDDNNPDVVPSLSDGCSRGDPMEEPRLTVVRDNCHTELYSPHPLNHVNFATFQGGSLGRPSNPVLPLVPATTVMDPFGSDRESVV